MQMNEEKRKRLNSIWMNYLSFSSKVAFKATLIKKNNNKNIFAIHD